jgi:hypothetical protein
MADPVALIVTLTGCSEDEARSAYSLKGDTVDAIEHILNKTAPLTSSIGLPRKRQRDDMTHDEAEITKIRTTMESFDTEISNKLTSNQHAASSEAVTLIPREEMVLQNSYFQECQIPSVQEEAQTQETECQ